MKLLIAILAICLGVAATTRAEAQNYPWCSYYTASGGGGTNCGFTTFQQCLDNVRGIGGFVIAKRNISRRPARNPCRNRKAAIRRKTFTKPRAERTHGTKESVRFPPSPFEPV
jgi:hypothetical protein